MDGVTLIFLLVLVLFNQAISGAFCAFVAREKNRSATNWFWLGFCFGPLPIALLALAALPSRNRHTIEDIVLNWVEIKPGSFCMSDGNRAVAVTLTSPFKLGQSQITQRQWASVMGTEPWVNRSNVQIGDKNAASYIDWDEAEAFCQRLTDHHHNNGKLPAGESYRLPTEAEWEYACRAGTTTAFSFGDDEKQLGEYAWFKGNTGSEQYAHKVGLKKPNPWGLYDMHGNVWEWCSDWYDEKLSGGTDPVGPDGGSFRVLRGGSWWFDPGLCRSAYRFDVDPWLRGNDLGFRVARSQSVK